MQPAWRLLTLLCLLGSSTFFACGAQAAGTAFAVDTSEISEVGSCKVESWLSVASNRDVVATGNPSCVVDLGRAVEISTQFLRSRADDEWASSVAPKAKTKLMPTSIGNFGLAVAGGGSVDLKTGETTSLFAYAPATLRLSETLRINLNAGWLWDREMERNFATYGAGFDWKLTDILTLTAETFGQVTRGDVDPQSVTHPRFQVGLRARPIDTLSFDFIYGRNINGEDAHWLTFATTVRFPAGK